MLDVVAALDGQRYPPFHIHEEGTTDIRWRKVFWSPEMQLVLVLAYFAYRASFRSGKDRYPIERGTADELIERESTESTHALNTSQFLRQTNFLNRLRILKGV